jgi:disease resistance protein RPM1
LYLSIFPEDYIINKENLIRRWIGEGFVYKEDNRTMYESGKMYFNDLINRSLIQPVEINETFDGHEVKICRVHDTVHDFIISKAVEENFVTIIGVPGVVNPEPRKNKIRRLSLQKDGEIPPGLVVSNARSLHVFGRDVKIPSMSEFRLLRVLDFDECWQLEDDDFEGVGNFLHLKYLRFRHAHSVTKLPEELARVLQLEIDIDIDVVQNCGDGKVMKIPEIIQNQLVCYVTVFADFHTALPDEVANIQGLQVLENVDVYAQSIEFIEGLGRLKNLRKLGIHFEKYLIADDYCVQKQKKAVFSVWKLGDASLESLYILIDEDDPNPDYQAQTVIEEDWFPNPLCGIRELVIEGSPLPMVPEWMKSLVNLEKLSLRVSGIGKKDMKILGSMATLSYLHIKWDKESDGDGGPKMKAKMKRAMEAHPNRPTLVWTYFYSYRYRCRIYPSSSSSSI